MEKLTDSIREMLHEHTSQIVEQTSQKFRLYPKQIIWFILFLSYNVLLQGIADIGLKFIGYTPWFDHMEIRVDFLFLTAVSVLMGYQALKGMRRRELDVTRNSVAIGLLVEAGLVISDVMYVIQNADLYRHLFWIRLPFIVLTTINLFILIYIAVHFRLFWDKKRGLIIA